MTDLPISGRKLLEAAKRVRARRLRAEGADDGRLPSDAELLALIEAETAERKEAHRERMRRYYRERQAVAAKAAEAPASVKDARTRSPIQSK